MKDCRENVENKETKKNTQKKPTLGVENDLRVVISSKADGILFDQICCTCINIILNDDGEIATSFMGIHNENIIKELEKAQKVYFKAIKKTLKEERKTAKDKLDAENKETDKTQQSDNNEKSTNSDIKTDENDSDNKNSNNDKKTIETNTPAYNHECDKSGTCIAKKKIVNKNPNKHKK